MSSLILLQNSLKNLGLNYFLLPNSDEFSSEYLPEYAKRLQFITGFSGSNAFAIISADLTQKSAFFTDSRYEIQAVEEIDQDFFDIFDLKDKKPLQWLQQNAQNSKIGLDGAVHSVNFVLALKQNFGDDVVLVNQNPVDQIWKNQPQPPKSKIFDHELQYCGKNSAEKVAEITQKFDDLTDAIIITDPASVCWLFNIRAADVAYSPLFLGFGLVKKDGKSQYYSPFRDDFEQKIIDFLAEDKNIGLDFHQANFGLYQFLQRKNFNIFNKTNPCLALKAVKNKTEIANAILTHKIDGAAVSKFLSWLQNALESGEKIDELGAAQKLLEFRQENKEFLYPSFATIAGFGSNGAIVHYQPSAKSNKILQKGSLFLVDSGGQYLSGTTDITRTIAIGKPTAEMIQNFTLVLKGHIAIARAKFPIGTTGQDLDTLARYHLWQNGLDYGHGTGHGVGSFLSVHEAPPSISKRASAVLQEGMILSNEPGYYKAGEYGIRIENLILVEKCQKMAGFLQFKTISLAPIDKNLIDLKMLDEDEKKWLIDYQKLCK